MTLTYPILNQSWQVLWLLTGSEKVGMLVRLRNGDVSISAGIRPRGRRARADPKCKENRNAGNPHSFQVSFPVAGFDFGCTRKITNPATL